MGFFPPGRWSLGHPCLGEAKLLAAPSIQPGGTFLMLKLLVLQLRAEEGSTPERPVLKMADISTVPLFFFF